MTVNGQFGYASVTGECRSVGDGLVVLDLAHPSKIQRLSAFNPEITDPWDDPEGCGIWSLPAYQSVAQGSMVYLATLGRGVYGLDMGQPSNPELRFHISEIGYAWGLAVDGDILYIATNSKGLLVYNIRDARTPLLIGEYPTKGAALALTLDKDHLYLVDDQEGLMVFARTQAGQLNARGALKGQGLSAYSLAARDGFVYLADYLEGFLIVDVHDTAQPKVVGSLVDLMPWDLALSGSRAYLVDEQMGLLPVDISQPDHPQVIGNFRRNIP
jgi:hypothetical protein